MELGTPLAAPPRPDAFSEGSPVTALAEQVQREPLGRDDDSAEADTVPHWIWTKTPMRATRLIGSHSDSCWLRPLRDAHRLP